MQNYIIVALLRFNKAASDSIQAQITDFNQVQMTQKVIRSKLNFYSLVLIDRKDK